MVFSLAEGAGQVGYSPAAIRLLSCVGRDAGPGAAVEISRTLVAGQDAKTPRSKMIRASCDNHLEQDQSNRRPLFNRELASTKNARASRFLLPSFL